MANQVTDSDRIDAIETLCLMVNQSSPNEATVRTQDGDLFMGKSAREVIDKAIEHFRNRTETK